MNYRIEKDTMGEVQVPDEKYWGAQTQRSLQNFEIGGQTMPLEIVYAFAVLKKAAALTNQKLAGFDDEKTQAIAEACDEVLDGQHDDQFPLVVWQTGSGTQSNMNVNEVIANRAIQLLGGRLGSQSPVAPNDDVNMGQSSNDTFPTAMHIASLQMIDDRLLPQLAKLRETLHRKSEEWMSVVKIGRTHLEDAVPLTVGQEWSGYAAQLDACAAELDHARRSLQELAMGGTAVGTGLNAPEGFGAAVARELSELTGTAYATAPNKFAALGSLDAMVRAHAALRGIAVAAMKIANDMRWLASGPRSGIGELLLPQNEPGSSIMPGKVNPTQCEAMVMISIQVIGNDTAVAFAGSQGNFELNAMRPLIINSFLHSAEILADGIDRFLRYSVADTALNQEVIGGHVERSLMLVTALSPEIGYRRAARIAEQALAKNLSLRDAAIASGLVTAEQFDRVVDPTRMTGTGLAGA